MKLHKSLISITLSIFVSSIIFLPATFSADEFYSALMYEKGAANEIEVIAGDIYVIKVEGVRRVSVIDPSVADVQKVAAGEIIIAGKTQGATILNVWTDSGKKQYRINVISEDLPSLKKNLKEIIHQKLDLTNVTLRENKSTGKIMLLGNVTQDQRNKIEQVIAPFAAKIEDLLVTKKEQEMVEIDVQILELNKNDTKNLGVDWMDSLEITEAAPAASSSWKSLWQTGTWSRGNLSATLHMLIKEDKGKVLSRPKLLCLNGEEAKLLVGGEIPYLSGTTTGAAGSTTTIEYKEYGIKLLIKPFILEDQVYLSLTAEVSDLDPDNGITVDGTFITAFSLRTAQTVVNVHSGDTVFLGGLIDNDDSDIINKLPGFSKIPILGALFRSKEFQSDKTELFITLTPKIISLRKKKMTQRMDNEFKAKSKVTPLYQKPAIPANLQSYAFGIQRKILENISYPRELSGTGWRGKVTLYLKINQYGQLKQVQIKESSGYEIFDQDAVDLVKQLSFYPFPAEIEKEEIDVKIPIVYQETN
ncbi:MAG: TonB family protein [Candidatus Omnitrophica bacterium]|nr:TonB family protein [Candidatus Omnitrophota bacterium]